MIRVFLKSIFLFLLPMLVVASPVDINTADAEKIAESLKGVGPGKAAAIVAFRVENGPFLHLNDLSLVKGIGKKTVESNKDDIQILLNN